ncbi:CPBP family intramembrane glutamic endopeptidase [Rhodoplanes azumiensis]|uniref:CPBP family intramembrane glutamic endopeptidase n=1 Tax=Rhodoplanes azumiensis TaxID=1897628 RepID=A0ABW5ADG1_9BRAD
MDRLVRPTSAVGTTGFESRQIDRETITAGRDATMQAEKTVYGVSARAFFVVWLAGLVGAAAVIPYAFTLHGKVSEHAPMSPLWLASMSLAQSAVSLAIATFVGLRLLGPAGYELIPTRPYARLSILLGVGVAGAIVVAEASFVHFSSYTGLPGVAVPAVWQGLLASLYGGITEEILSRLFVMTLVAWAVGRLFGRSPRSAPVARSAILVSALLFGIGHLPALAQSGSLSAIVVVRTVCLNAMGGVVFGWLYWRRGLVAAMLAHLTADLVLHVIVPTVVGSLESR